MVIEVYAIYHKNPLLLIQRKKIVMLIRNKRDHIESIQSKQNYIEFIKQIFYTNSEKTKSFMLVQNKENYSKINVEISYLGCRDTIRSG